MSAVGSDIGCDGLYGKDGQFRRAMCYTTSFAGITNFMITGTAAVACAVSPSINRNLLTICSPAVADHFSTASYPLLCMEWSLAMVVSPLLLLLQLGPYVWLSSADKKIGSMMLAITLLGVLVVLRNQRMFSAYTGALKWQAEVANSEGSDICYPHRFWHWSHGSGGDILEVNNKGNKADGALGVRVGSL